MSLQNPLRDSSIACSDGHDGEAVGCTVGLAEAVGVLDGDAEGMELGVSVGIADGTTVGIDVVGAVVGEQVPHLARQV